LRSGRTGQRFTSGWTQGREDAVDTVERRESVMGLAAEIVEAGATAGALAGVAMVLFLCVYALATGMGFLTPLRLLGATFYGRGALNATLGFGPAFWGLCLHLAVSIALGVFFAAIVSRDTGPMAATSGGIAYGLAAWALLTFLVLPVVNPVMRRALQDFSIGWFAAHVPFGATLGLAQQLRRTLATREARLRRQR